MRALPQTKLLAAFLAALFVSGAGQTPPFMQCGPAARGSCCCPMESQAAPSSTVTRLVPQCCETLALPSTPRRNTGGAVSSLSAPIRVAVLWASVAPRPAAEPGRPAPRLDPPQRPSLVLANCALLI